MRYDTLFRLRNSLNCRVANEPHRAERRVRIGVPTKVRRRRGVGIRCYILEVDYISMRYRYGRICCVSGQKYARTFRAKVNYEHTIGGIDS